MGKQENIQQFYKKKSFARKAAQQMRSQRFISVAHRIWENLVSRISQEIPYGYRKDCIKDLLGCDKQLLIDHLSKTFHEGMSLENYPQWEPDHIKPVASFDLRKDSDQKICFHYTNLQALWKRDNRSKGANEVS